MQTKIKIQASQLPWLRRNNKAILSLTARWLLRCLGFVGSDNQGLEGIEAYYDEVLTGENGRIITVADAASKSISG